MLKEVDCSHLTVIIFVVVRFVSMYTTTNHPCVVTLNEVLSPYCSSARFLLMFCSTNFVTEKNIDVCFQKRLSCVSNISFNMITCQLPVYVLHSKKHANLNSDEC